MFLLDGTVSDTPFILDDFKITSSSIGDSPNKDKSVFIQVKGPRQSIQITNFIFSQTTADYQTLIKIEPSALNSLEVSTLKLTNSTFNN